MTSASRQRDQAVRKTVQKSRSRGRNGGLGRFRFRTATLLAKREDFDSDIRAVLQEDAGRGNQGQKKM
jgi:hypothetical protein